LNPLIYPSWWGQDEEVPDKDEIRSISADKRREDSLDKRLREAERNRIE
jgi:hypothetical protein